MFRVSQGHGFGVYGVRTFVNRIVDLTPDSYSECCVATVSTRFRAGLAGTHHLHSNNAITVFDYARFASVRS